MPKKKSCLTRGLAILFLVGVLGVVLLYIGVRAALVNWVRREMTAEEYAKMEDWLDAKVEFPEAWSQPEPFSKELNETAERIRPVVEYWLRPEHKEALRSPKHPLIEKLAEGEKLSEDEWEQVKELRSEVRPLLDAALNFTALPDYEVEAFALLDYENQHVPFSQKVNGDLLSLIAWRFALEAYLNIQQENWSQGFENVRSILRLVKRHPATETFGHLLSANLEIIAAHLLSALADRCDDSQTLSTILREVKDVTDEYPEDFLESIYSLDVI